MLIVVHGGAGDYRDRDGARRRGLLAAAEAGHDVLLPGGDPVTAVVAAVRVLEDDPVFNAGRGSVLNARGEVEMDAGLMRGSDQKFGAVAAVTGTPAPVSLARLVLESDQVLLVGKAAVDFGVERGLGTTDPGLMIAPHRHRAWSRWVAAGMPREFPEDFDEHDTVGAVAVDGQGRLAAATSTGGIAYAPPGRVGDAPLPGCGFWADAGAAASATGEGEQIARILACYAARAELAAGASAQQAAETVVRRLGEQVGGRGGVILAAVDGSFGAAFNTAAMGHAWRGDGMPAAECAGLPA